MNGSPKLVHRQIRIFVPPAADGNHWVETVVGRVIKPVVERHKPEWMWFSRYGEDKERSSVDCDISKIPTHFGKNGFYRSVHSALVSTVDDKKNLNKKRSIDP